jgi:tetratricopeptide (TPR) repeat protein
MKKLLLILLCLPLLVFSQDEKRLALVIGNANYDNGELTNPVNDARLIKNALDSLNFEVHYFENLTTKDEVYQSVRGFVKKLDSADISFIYYSGHGIQVDGLNYLVPTKVELTDEEDVKQYCYEFSNIMRFLSKYDDQVNIVVLDACRNNRYENSWSGKSYGGNGLASMDSPDGCILAFSTKTGKVAKDNSFYAKYLSEYMLEPGLEIKNVFQRVRTKVNSISKGKQTPVETHQMFKDYYLVKSNYEKQFSLIDSLVEIGESVYLSEAMGIASSILNADSDNKKALLKKGDIYIELKDYIKALKEYNKAIKLYPNDPNCFNYRGNMYSHDTKEYKKAIADFSHCIEIDSTYWPAYSNRADTYLELVNYEKALEDYTSAIDLDKENPERYIDRSDCYVYLNDYDNALFDRTKAIEIAENKESYYTLRADFYANYLENKEKALEDYDNAIKLAPEYKWPLNNKALVFMDQEKYDEALEVYDLIISFDSTYWRAYSNKAYIFTKQEKHTEALFNYNIVISYNLENPEGYDNRADCYIAMEDYTSALKDLDKAIDLDPEDPSFYNNRADFYKTQEKYDEALQDYNLIVKLFPNESDVYSNRAMLYVLIEEYDKANKDFNKAIKLDPENTTSYFYRAKMYHKQEEYEKEKADYLKTIEMNDEDPEGYYYLAGFYVNQNKSFQARDYFEKAISRLSADLGYYITAENGKDKIELADIYIKRAEVYKNAEAIELMCEDYKNACDLGDCEMFNTHCK